MSPRSAAVASALAALLLAGCSGLKSSAPAEQLYVLRPAAPAGAPAARVEATLELARPQPQPGLDTARIAVMTPGHHLDYVADARWSAPLGEVVGAFLLQDLRASGRFAQVTGEGLGVASDFVLSVTLRRFEADYAVAGGLPTVQVALECALLSRQEHRQVASFDATASVAAAANRQENIVQAFEQAAREASQQLVERTALAAASARAAEPRPAH